MSGANKKGRICNAESQELFTFRSYLSSAENLGNPCRSSGIGEPHALGGGALLKVRDLETGAELPDTIENWRYGLIWASDSRSFLYTDADENWRSKTVWHHRLGDPQSADRAVVRTIRRASQPNRQSTES